MVSVGSGLKWNHRVATYIDTDAMYHYSVNRSDLCIYVGITLMTSQGAGKSSSFQIVGIGSVQEDVVVDVAFQECSSCTGSNRPYAFSNTIMEILETNSKWISRVFIKPFFSLPLCSRGSFTTPYELDGAGRVSHGPILALAGIPY